MPRPPDQPGVLPTQARAAQRVAKVERRTPIASSGGGLQFNSGTYGADNVGDYLLVETTGVVGMNFSEPYAARHTVNGEGYGAGLNIDNGLLLTAPADSNFNSGNPVLDIEHYFSTGGYGAYGALIQVQDNTAGGGGGAIGLQILAGSNGTALSEPLITSGQVGASGSGDAYGAEFRAGNLGSGKEIAVLAFTDGHQSAGNSLALLCKTSGGTHIFEVRNDHNVLAPALPTSSAGLPSGALWNNANVVNIV